VKHHKKRREDADALQKLRETVNHAKRPSKLTTANNDPQKSQNSVDTVQRIPLKGQFTLSAVALAKADPGASKGKLEIKTETGVEPRTPSGFNKSHHSAASSTS
jgi:hypothetical protein